MKLNSEDHPWVSLQERKKCGKQKLSYPYESFKEGEIFRDNEF